MYLLIPVWENTILLVKNTLHDDPSPDDGTWWSQNDKFKSKQGRQQTSSGGKTLLRLGYHPVIYKTGTDWNWDVMGKESQEYLVKGLNPDHGMQYSHRLPLLTSIREPWKILLFAPVEVSNFEVHENT